MPQLDIATFSTQYFWLVLSFGTFFLCLVRWFLPSMARVLAYRAHAPGLADDESEQGAATLSEDGNSLAEQENVYQGMQTAIETTHREIHFTQEVEQAVYASAALRSQNSWITECTLLQAEGVAHTPFTEGSPIIAKITIRALLKTLQDRLR
jgi:hypothetical protein